MTTDEEAAEEKKNKKQEARTMPDKKEETIRVTMLRGALGLDKKPMKVGKEYTLPRPIAMQLISAGRAETAPEKKIGGRG